MNPRRPPFQLFPSQAVRDGGLGAAVGVGANANVLVGGSNSSITLQPLSLQGQTGLNLAVGVAAFELRYGP